MLAKYFVRIFVILNLKHVVAQGGYKSSLTFVIDDTYSMSDDIDQVIIGANAIFDTVLHHNASQIENFILVTFNDLGAGNPGVILRAVTKQRDVFKSALTAISVHGGGDCPEYSMTGIKQALEESLPSSYIYVFTDATAKDYEQFEEVKRIAQKKQSQIVFVLTGDCSEPKSSPRYKVYHGLATATSGEVFNLEKQEIGIILKYVINTIKGRRTTLARETFPPGKHNLNFTADSEIKDPTLSIATVGSEEPTVDVTGPDGKKVDKEIIVDTSKISIYKLNVTKPGEHTAEIGSTSGARAVVTARSDITFQHGFSTFKPKSSKDTSTRPAPDVKSYVSIQLINGDVKLEVVRILDMDDNVILEIPLEISNEKAKFYVTDPIDPPKTMFRIEIIGYDPESKTKINRKAATPIEVQKIIPGEIIKPQTPSVVIEGEAKRKVELNEKLQIVCKVNGYPKPDIVWKNLDDGTILTGEVSILELPYDYINVLTVEDVTKNATYQCEASNASGTDAKVVSVETPARYFNVLNSPKNMRIKYQKEVRVYCKVNAYPPVTSITWFKDGKKLSNLNDNIQLSNDNSTMIIKNARFSDEGSYMCEVRNKDKRQLLHRFVKVLGLLSLLPPKKSNLTVIVGTDQLLLCEAEGIPTPSIKWVFQSFSKPSTRKIIKSEKKLSLPIKHIQLNQQGYYTCIARNSGGSLNITYELHVLAPPSIQNIYKDKHFKAVEGDQALRITCKASGSPKPVITWTKDGWNIALGTTYYVEEEVLIIKHVTADVKGVYKCQADNSIGSDNDIFKVSVEKYPMPGIPTISIYAAEDEPVHVKCDVPHTKIDQLRWFRNGELIQTGELTLRNSTVRDSGIYTCRVSNFLKTLSGNVRVTIGHKPTFTSEEDEEIEIVEGPPLTLVCNADAAPEPVVSWYHDGNKLNSTEFYLHFETGISRPGQYRCEVTNVFGKITRTFTATPRDCFVNTDRLTKLQPLMVTSSLNWPYFERVREFIVFPKGEQFYLFCPNKFKIFPNQYVTAFCDGGTNIVINGKKYDYADIECTEEVKHEIQRTGKKCMPGATKTEKIKIVYKVLGDKTTEVYEICLNTTNNTPLYAKLAMPMFVAEDEYEADWSDGDQFAINFNEVYNCKNQINIISGMLRQWFHYDDNCCFSKRQLVSYKDVFPGVSQKSTYSYFNVVPQWGTCNNQNWDDIELRVRNFAKNSYRDILVWTGTAKELYLPDALKRKTNDFFMDMASNRQPVPLYLWKVIQDPASKASLAVIQVNVPDLSPSEVPYHVLCRDVCGLTDWMKSPNWHDVSRGYTYCCTIEEFEKAFGFRGVFDPGMEKILTVDAFTLPVD